MDVGKIRDHEIDNNRCTTKISTNGQEKELKYMNLSLERIHDVAI